LAGCLIYKIWYPGHVIPAEAEILMQSKEKPIYRITIAFKLAMTGTGRHYEYFQAGNDVITHPVIPAKAGTLMQSKEKPIYRITIASQAGNDGNGKTLRVLSSRQ